MCPAEKIEHDAAQKFGQHNAQQKIKQDTAQNIEHDTALKSVKSVEVALYCLFIRSVISQVDLKRRFGRELPQR